MKQLPKDRVSVWKFSSTPQYLQRFHPAGEPVTWITFVPKDFFHSNLDQCLLEGACKRYETEEGDFVYVGGE